jgi:gliding motility-associated-like protein
MFEANCNFIHIVRLAFILFILNTFKGYPQASFEVKDTICNNDSVYIINTSRQADTYYWSFCSGNLTYTPEGETLQNQEYLIDPAFIDIVKDNNGYYAFITNRSNSTLIRYYFGNNLLSVPEMYNLGNFDGIIPEYAQGVQVVKDNNIWYAFITGGQEEDSWIARINFGDSLSNNNPTLLNLGNIGYLYSPVDLFMFNENDKWYGFTVNSGNNTITRFNFGSRLTNRPDGKNLGNIGELDTPCGILPWNEDSSWYLFVSNFNSHQISRLELGNSLLNIPTGESIGDAEYLYNPTDLILIRDCEMTYGFVLNSNNSIVRLDFDHGISGDPGFISLGETSVLSGPHGISDIFRIGDTLYTFVTNIENSTVTRLFFTGCDNSYPLYSNQRDPPVIVYDSPGIYNISLALDEGTFNQEYFCKNIVVSEIPDFSLANDTIIPAGTILVLDAGDGYSVYTWSTGDTSQTIEVSTSGTYSVTVTNEYNCSSTDEIVVTVDIGVPNFITPNGDGYNDTWEIPALDDAINADIRIFDRFGKLIISYKGSDPGWDGTADGRLVSPDTYWYIIDLKDGSKPLKGSITVKH